MTASDTKRLARRVPEDIATEKNLDLVDDIFTDDFVEHGPFGSEVRGVDGVRDSLASYLDAFPDFEAVVEEILAEGDVAAMRVTLRGSHEGAFMGFEPTGNSFEVANMVFTRVEGEKIAERWLIPDALGMLQQLGVVPSLDDLRGTVASG